MSFKERYRPSTRVKIDREQLQRMQELSKEGAHRARERIGPTTQVAREIATERMLDAREWSAPRLVRAAHYVETELGPRVGTLLTKAADKVEPPRRQRQKRNTAMITLAAAGAIGAVGAMVSRRIPTNSPKHSEDVLQPSPTSADGQARIP
ncbi:hypothetical protein [Actinomadura alba]|uniref:Cell wall synthesis and cell shape protein A n=1 Tax=Actinomadura alba TaxID=406431 RepID=A0ABR7LVK5_9ACTN|nr:hypothetical protein [Actinomadura alba]MBC6468490.1 hypothetical protein [Actinomadura alba]